MKDPTRSYYDILDISPEVSDEDVKRAYRKLALRYHLDLNPEGKADFCMISEAYAQLKTTENRERYNQRMNIEAENDNDPNQGSRESWLMTIAQIFFAMETGLKSRR